MSNAPTKPGPPTFGTEHAAQALNEHGFIFQQMVRHKLQHLFQECQDRKNENFQEGWELVGEEYPVMTVGETKTRVDLVLRHQRLRGLHICLECKRPNPKYKTWLFFDRAQDRSGASEFFVENVSGTPPLTQHEILRLAFKSICPVFMYYVEAGFKKGMDSASSTEGIEKAFRQLIDGSSGMMRKRMCNYRPEDLPLRSIPVLVTTAQVTEARFGLSKVSVEEGTIKPEDLHLEAVPFCAVNYHADVVLSPLAAWLSNTQDVEDELANAHTRTVFVVHFSAIGAFLSWAGKALTSG